MSIYEVHLGSWRPGLDYRELGDQLADHLTEPGFTHVELMPIAEHPFGGSWGYQVTSYYAPTSRYGSPEDFRWFVDELHQRGIGVIVDWVPAHFPDDEWALARFDGTRCTSTRTRVEASSPTGARTSSTTAAPRSATSSSPTRCSGSRSSTSTACGSMPSPRCSISTTPARTGEWVPNKHGGRENLEAVQLLQELNATVYKHHPGVVMIAEESTAWPGVSSPTDSGGLGFGFKWNMGWMHDTLDYLGHEPVHRSYHHGEMTFSIDYAWTEHFILPLSHDEVVHGKGRCGSACRATTGTRRPAYARCWRSCGRTPASRCCSWAASSARRGSGRSRARWSGTQLDEPLHSGILHLVSDLNALLPRGAGALLRRRPPKVQWSTRATSAAMSSASCGSARTARSWPASPTSPGGRTTTTAWGCLAGTWREVVNTDSEIYGGSGVGNLGAVEAGTMRGTAARLGAAPAAAGRRRVARTA